CVTCLCFSLPFVRIFSSHGPATPVYYTLSLHDALPISSISWSLSAGMTGATRTPVGTSAALRAASARSRACGEAARGSSVRLSRSEEHTSELQSLRHLVCRLLLEKKKAYRR